MSVYPNYFFLTILTLFLLFNIGLSIIFRAFEKPRQWNTAEILVLVLLCMAQWLNASVLPPKRETALSAEFHRFVARSQPLVDAIHAYESDHGHPPIRLSELVPHYLPQVPETGVTSLVFGHRYGYHREKNGWRICNFPETQLYLGTVAYDYQSPSFARMHAELAGIVERSNGWMYVRDKGVYLNFWDAGHAAAFNVIAQFEGLEDDHKNPGRLPVLILVRALSKKRRS